LSGPAVVRVLAELGFTDILSKTVPDEVPQIQAAIKALGAQCAAVFTTGGTGFSRRDVTPEATLPLLDRRADNLSELMRLKGLEQTEFSYLSRGVCGVMGACLVVNLPGSPAGAEHSLRSIGKLIPPILEALQFGTGTL
jgi:molybdopterin adenylyltransferase